MAVEKRFSINLDIKRSTSNRDFEVVEGDTGNYLDIVLTDNGELVDVSECLVAAIFTRGDGKIMQQDNETETGVTVSEKSHIEIHLFNTSFSPGLNECELQIFSGEDRGTLVTSAKFNFKCRRGSANEETVQSTEEWPLLVGLIKRVEGAEDKLEELIPQAEETIDRSNAAAEQAQEAAQNAGEKADDAATAAQAATEAAGKANAAADTAEAAGREAASAADRASGVLDDAETATAAANEAAGEANEAANAANSAAATAATAAGNASAAAQAANTAAGRANDVLDDAQQAANAANSAAGRANTAAGEAETAADRANDAAKAAEDIVGGALPEHAHTHAKGGSDEITLDMLGAADAQTVTQLQIDVSGKAAKATSLAVVLLATNWNGEALTQMVTGSGVTATGNVIVSPAPASYVEWGDCAVYCSAQAEGALYFVCETIPENDLTANVLIVG